MQHSLVRRHNRRINDTDYHRIADTIRPEVLLMRFLPLLLPLLLAGCLSFSSSNPPPPAPNTVVVPPGTTVVCPNGMAPPC